MSMLKASARMLLNGAFGVLVLAAISGCGQAVRFLRETPEGGTVTMPTNTNRWPSYYRKQAESLMQQKCPDGYRIDREGAVGGAGADPAFHRGYDSYFGYTGGSEAEQEYHIIFHRAPQGKQPPVSDPSRKPNKSDSSSRPSSLPAEAGTDELPPPRPLSLPE